MFPSTLSRMPVLCKLDLYQLGYIETIWNETQTKKKNYFTNHIKCGWAENLKQKAKIVRSDKNIKTDP